MEINKNRKKNLSSFAAIAAAVVLVSVIAFTTASCGSSTNNSSENSGSTAYRANENSGSTAYSTNEISGSTSYSTNENNGSDTSDLNECYELVYSNENITRETIAEINKAQIIYRLAFVRCSFDEGVLAELAPHFDENIAGFIDFASCTGVDDLSFVSKCESVTNFVCQYCGLTDSVASSFSNAAIENVYLSGNPELTHLTLNTQNLYEIDLSNTKVENIDFLASAKELSYLNLENTNVSDLSPIAPLAHISYLNLSGTKVNSFETELNSSFLRELYLNGCGLTSSDGLEKYVCLEKLDLGNNSLTDVSFIAPIVPSLKMLILSGNDITGSDLTFLENAEEMCQLGLDSIDLSECQLSYMENMPHLEMLLARNCNLTDISGIQNCTNLACIVLGFNNISDVSPIPSFEGYPATKQILDLTDNQVESLALLNRSFHAVMLSGNPISDGEVGESFWFDTCMIDYFDGLESSALLNGYDGFFYIIGCPEDKQEEIKNIAKFIRFCTRAEQLEEIVSQYREVRYDEFEEMYLAE